MRPVLSTREAAEWLWMYIKQQGYNPAEYMPWEAMREMSDLQAFYPKHPACLWFKSSSAEAQQAFLTHWYQMLQQKQPAERSAQ